MKRKFCIKLLLCQFLLLLTQGMYAQEDEYTFLKMPTLIPDSTDNKFCARIYENTFFKNNEYFGDFVKGYTLTGYHLQSEVAYNPNSMLSLQLMWNILKYHGYDNYSENKLNFRIVFQPKQGFRIICGYLEGNVRHNLIEPIYNPERYYTNNVENGIQINLWRPRYSGELWLNWEKFILWDDPWQERLTVGHLSKFHIVKQNNFCSNVLMNLLVSHRGGQIDNSTGQVQSLENAALGVDFHWMGNSPKKGYYRQLSIQAMVVQYHAIDETPDLPWLNGYGTYVKSHLILSNFGLILGHWFGYKFVNFRGDPLYTGWAIDSWRSREHRYVAFAGGYYSKKYFDDKFVLRTGVDAWYDIAKGNLEYAYMLSMAFNLIAR
jgi:hypothetical protein